MIAIASQHRLGVTARPARCQRVGPKATLIPEGELSYSVEEVAS